MLWQKRRASCRTQHSLSRYCWGYEWENHHHFLDSFFLSFFYFGPSLFLFPPFHHLIVDDFYLLLILLLLFHRSHVFFLFSSSYLCGKKQNKTTYGDYLTVNRGVAHLPQFFFQVVCVCVSYLSKTPKRGFQSSGWSTRPQMTLHNRHAIHFTIVIINIPPISHFSE